MAHQLMTLLSNTISNGLKRKAVTKTSEWAETYRIMGQPFPGPWSFAHHPWAREMHDCESEIMVGQKAAQMGFTEVALNKTFKAIDIDGVSVLYLLPASDPDASDFSTSRFDPALEMSTHLQNMFTDVKNIGHKRAGNANLFIRGSRSRSQVKSLPVGCIIFDEVDEMVQDNIPLAMERLSGQIKRQAFLLSTPRVEDVGINVHYKQSTMEHFFFKCPHCSKLTQLVYPECLVVTSDDSTDPDILNSHLICKECKMILKHEEKSEYLGAGQWVPEHSDRLIRGFHVNQLYSMAAEPYKIAITLLKAQTNPADEQEFYNSKLGITHAPDGAQISEKDITECVKDYVKTTGAPRHSVVTMGVDVGKWLHYEIDAWHVDTNDSSGIGRPTVIAEGKLLNFEDLDTLMRDYSVAFCVVDASPERRKAFEFAQRFYGYVKICYYGRGVTGKQIHEHAEEEQAITVDRTSWLDLSLGRFRNQTIKLPRDTSIEYREHLKALTRIYEKDRDGNPISRYIKSNLNDHFAHARNYAEIAIQLGIKIGTSQDITGVF